MSSCSRIQTPCSGYGVPIRSRRGRIVFPIHRSSKGDRPLGIVLRWFTLRTLVDHWVRTPRPKNVAQPEVELGKGDAQWWRVPAYDSALVSSADGSGKSIYTRDPAKYRRMLIDTVRLHARLKRDWPKLQRQYRRALPDLTSEEAWRRTFEQD